MTTVDEYKIEKKLMEERIRKVRSVLPCVSNNDIVLALHNHDLDVDRTIQAFAEDADAALGSWAKKTDRSKKSKPKKQQSQQTPHEAAPAPASTATKSNGYTNGRTNGTATAAAAPVASSSSSAAKPKSVPAAATKAANVETLNRLDGADKTKAIASEVSKHTADLTTVSKQFNAEVAAAEASLAQCFKEIRAATNNRERQLAAALSAVRADGTQFLSQRQAALRAIAAEANAAKAASELKAFLAAKNREVALAHTTRFLYDNSQLIRAIDAFGDVVSVSGDSGVAAAPVSTSTPVPVTPSHSAIKHATSHSSIVSSVGEDSGLGQISPVANEKPVAHVENGGIVMQSQGLSAAQLADIQRQVAERLKASGIDTACLDNASAPRRRPPPSERKPKAHANGNNHNNKKANGHAQPIELSILQ